LAIWEAIYIERNVQWEVWGEETGKKDELHKLGLEGTHSTDEE
jgi:hypothetical protein